MKNQALPCTERLILLRLRTTGPQATTYAYGLHQQLNITNQTITKALHRLTNRGLIERAGTAPNSKSNIRPRLLYRLTTAGYQRGTEEFARLGIHPYQHTRRPRN